MRIIPMILAMLAAIAAPSNAQIVECDGCDWSISFTPLVLDYHVQSYSVDEVPGENVDGYCYYDFALEPELCSSWECYGSLVLTVTVSGFENGDELRSWITWGGVPQWQPGDDVEGRPTTTTTTVAQTHLFSMQCGGYQLLRMNVTIQSHGKDFMYPILLLRVYCGSCNTTYPE